MSYEKERAILDSIEKADQELLAEIRRRVDWDNPEDVLAHRSLTRLDKRLEALDRLSPIRKCPSCKLTPKEAPELLKTSSWVISKRLDLAVCRRCWLAAKGLRVTRTSSLSFLIIPPRRYGLKGFQLKQLREIAGVSARQFAKAAGWNGSYQCKLEQGRQKTISHDVAETLIETLARFGVVSADDLYADAPSEDPEDSEDGTEEQDIPDLDD